MSSSIFSSETLRRCLALPAAQKRRDAVVVLLALVVFAGGHWLAGLVGEALLPYGPVAPFLLARESLATSRVVFAGSSHAFLGIDPREVPFPSTNVAAPGWDYTVVEAAVRNNLDRMSALELAVVELDPVPLRIDSTSVLRGSCRALRVWGIPPEEVPCDDLEGGGGPLGELETDLIPRFRLTPHSIWDAVKPSFRGPAATIGPIAGHRIIGLRRPTAAQIERDGRKRVQWVAGAFGGDDLRRNRAALLRLVALFTERGVPVVMLTLPHQHSFSSNTPPGWRRELRQILERLRHRSGRRIPWWNFETDPAYGAEDFMDSVHLNSRGARAFSRRLGSRVADYLRRLDERD